MSTSPWTKAQRQKLSAILHPDESDPAEVVLPPDQAWKATKLPGAPATRVVPSQLAATKKPAALVDYWVGRFGLMNALRDFHAKKAKTVPATAFLPFRRHLYATDEATFAEARALIWTPASLSFPEQAAFALLLSRDQSIAEAVAAQADTTARPIELVLAALQDPRVALDTLGRVQPMFVTFHETFEAGAAYDLAEGMGAMAVPVFEEILARYRGMAKNRKGFTEAMEIAKKLVDRAPAPAKEVVMPAESGPLAMRNTRIALSGKFSQWTNAELEVLLRARGAQVAKAPSKDTRYLMSADSGGSKVEKARALGQRVFLEDEIREALGPALGGYRERLEAARGEGGDELCFRVGDAVDPKIFAKVEERIGFPVPEGARTLWGQLDGLHWAWRWRTNKASPDEAERATFFGTRPHWSKLNPHKPSAVTCLLPVESIFFRRWDDDLFSSSAWGAEATIKLGSRQVKAQDLFRNLFLFDDFHDYYCAALWADPETRSFQIVYGTDHGADFGWAHAVPFEVYLEFLLVDRGAARLIALNSKLGATTAIRNESHNPWLTLSPFA